MKRFLLCFGVLLSGLAMLTLEMPSATAQQANRCDLVWKRLERQVRIDAAFRCNVISADNTMRRSSKRLPRCSGKQRRHLARLWSRRSQRLERCIESHLQKAAVRERSKNIKSRAGEVARRQGAKRRSARSDTHDLVDQLLAQGPLRLRDEIKERERRQPRDRTFRAGLAWSYAGPLKDMHCVQWKEPSDPHDWKDNYLCSETDVGLQWSFRGPILGRGLRCIQVREKSDPHDWHDNFFCWPRDLKVTFRFSSTGRIDGYRCLAIVEPSDPHTWRDNYLCHRPT